MDEPFDYVKNLVVNFKLNYCCHVAPVRIGLLIVAYFNIIFDLASIVGIGDESYKPIILQVEEVLLPDYVSKPVPMLCYAAEFAFNVLLLAAVYRRDSVLYRVYMYWCIATLITSIMFYSVVIVAIGMLMKIATIMSIVFQCYIILLVRSAIVELKLERKNGELPTFVISSLVHDREKNSDVESHIHEDEKLPSYDDDQKKKDTKLETVEEHPKEEV